MNILVIGRMGWGHQGQGYATAFEKAGHTVYRIATDIAHPKNSGKFDQHALRDLCSPGGEKSLAYIKLFLENDFDFIFMVQNDLVWKIKSLNNAPIYYYVTCGFWPRLPRGNVKGILWSYFNGSGKYSDIHPVEMYNMDFKAILPLGVDLNVWPLRPQMEYKRDVGFIGQWSGYNNTYEKRHAYDDRKKYLDYIKGDFKKDNPDIEIEVRGPDLTNLRGKYIEFIHETRLNLNIGATFGYTNMRQFEVLALGGLLVQHAYPRIQDLGYKDGDNCILFKNERELDLKINYILDNNEDFDRIRKGGIKFAEECTFDVRVESFFKILEGAGK